MGRSLLTPIFALQASCNTLSRLVAVRRNGTLHARYEYDASGGRVKTTVYQASMPTGFASSGFGTPQGEIVTHFVRSLYERVVDTGVTSRHVYLGPLRVVSVASDGRTRYAHSDHLGGTNVTTDETGQERERIEYAPFGQVVAHTFSGGSTEEAYFQYTGHRFDEESDLLFMEARYYDPRLARFLTPDSLVPDVTNPQALNRYAYAYNNPVRLTDPSGHSPQDEIDAGKEPTEQENVQENVAGPSAAVTGGAGAGAQDQVVIGDSDGVPLNLDADGAGREGSGPEVEERRGFWGSALKFLGHVWSLPNTLIGVVYGLLGIPLEGIGIGDGQLQFKGHLLSGLLNWIGSGGQDHRGAITLGDAGVFSPDFGPDTQISGQTVGEHEGFHSVQGRLLGPLYLPANLLGGSAALLSSGSWRGSSNFMERGPYNNKAW